MSSTLIELFAGGDIHINVFSSLSYAFTIYVPYKHDGLHILLLLPLKNKPVILDVVPPVTGPEFGVTSPISGGL